jgi:hypothetical protein
MPTWTRSPPDGPSPAFVRSFASKHHKLDGRNEGARYPRRAKPSEV